LRWTSYSTVNKRIKALQESGFIKGIGSKSTKAGFEATLYEITSKFGLAFFLINRDIDKLISELDDNTSIEVLLLFLRTKSTKVFLRRTS
jgi:DNA-binding Lrp family transcriptional regulator